jgi:integrative and conjugative element protein (TIGR02256 family)
MWRRRSVAIATVWLAQKVIDSMLDEATAVAPNETGGMLLGYEGMDAPEPVVTEVIGPGPNARHSPSRFEPDADWQQGEVERIYADSGRITTYLGDWHTHPRGPARPSRKDRRTARRIARSKEARAPAPLMLIAGRDEKEWTIVCYRLRRRRLEPVQLRPF